MGRRRLNNTWVGNLTPHVEYKIQVRARNRIGPGPWSSLTLIPRKKPVELTIDSVTPGDGTLTISWTDGGDDEITGYDVRYTYITFADPHPDSTDWEYIRNITGTSPLEYTITGLVNGRRYEVQVRGRNRYGVLPSDFSIWSDRVTAKPATTPDTPAIGSVASGDRMLTVAWSAPAEDGGRDITSYDLRYIRSDAADKSDASWTVKASVWSSGALRHALSGLTNGVEYEVQLRAENSVGEGPWSPAGIGTPLTTPGAPSIESVTPGDETFTVAWSAPASDGGRDITGYDLRYIRSDAPSKADVNWTVKDSIWTSGALRYILGGLTNGVDYDVQVRAVNAVGRGAWSGTGAGKPLTTPSAPIHRLGDSRRRDAHGGLVRPGRHRRQRGHRLRPALHPVRCDGQVRRKLDRQRQRLDLRRTAVHSGRPDQRRPVRPADSCGQRGRGRPVVRRHLRRAPNHTRSPHHRLGDSRR